MALKLISAPTAEPITLAEAKLHLRVDSTDDDSYITALIVAARQAAEHITERALLPQTWEMALDSLDGEIQLLKPPLVSITSFQYVDVDGVLQTYTGYALDNYSEPARLTPSYGTDWPVTRDQANSVLIRFVAGYADAASVPQEIKSWILLRIGSLYENRESIADSRNQKLQFIDGLLDATRIWNM